MRIGDKILHYEVLSQIGEGGTGKVFKVKNLNNYSEAAIKAILPHLAHNELAINRFKQETEILARLFHENIIRLEQLDHSTKSEEQVKLSCII